MTSRRTFRLDDLVARVPEQLAKFEEFKERVDITGMTRPVRDPVEKAWLDEQGMASPFIECEVNPRQKRPGSKRTP
jgi:hypothetical protein